MVDIKILGSKCDVSNDYLEVISELATDLDLNFTIVKVEDEKEMTPYDVSISCMYGYCSGCKNNHADSNEKHTPALVINDELFMHSVFPSDEKLIKILEKFN